MMTTTASSYKSCDLQELKMAGKRKIVQSWVESWLQVLGRVLARILARILGRVLARIPGLSPAQNLYYW